MAKLAVLVALMAVIALTVTQGVKPAGAKKEGADLQTASSFYGGFGHGYGLGYGYGHGFGYGYGYPYGGFYGGYYGHPYGYGYGFYG